MAIITLTSDWGISGYYAAAVKGVILSKMPNAVIVDVCHNVKPFDHFEPAFLVKNTYPTFPEGTVHIIAVDSVENELHQHLVVKLDGQYFVCSDNGILSILVGNKSYEAVVVEVEQDTNFYTFSARDRFAKIAVMLANGARMDEIGGEYKQKLYGSGVFQPRMTNNGFIEGIVIYVDSYGNAITNITKELYEQFRNGHECIVEFNNYYADIKECYDDVQRDDTVAFFGTHGYLEIALNKESLSLRCGVYVETVVMVKTKS